MRWVQDPNHAGDTGTDERAYQAFFDYDSFHRLGRQSAPKSTSTDRGTLLWSSVEFDAERQRGARRSTRTSVESPATPRTAPSRPRTFDAMDRPTAGHRTGHQRRPGRRTHPIRLRRRRPADQGHPPKGVADGRRADDFATVYGYDALDRVIRQPRTAWTPAPARPGVTHACYDLAGDLRSMTAPRAGLTTVTCPGNGPATAPFTTDVRLRRRAPADRRSGTRWATRPG